MGLDNTCFTFWKEWPKLLFHDTQIFEMYLLMQPEFLLYVIFLSFIYLFYKTQTVFSHVGISPIQNESNRKKLISFHISVDINST